MMLFLRLTLLTSLFAAPVCFVSGENMITCPGDIQRLTCDTGLIKVKSTTYGRTNSNTCSAGRPASQVVNTNCSAMITTIAERCNGLRVCELKTDFPGIPDPCPAIYKYYNTTYDCISGQNIVICDQGYSTLDCGNAPIQIINANYGRADSVTCVNGLPSSMLQNTSCYAPNTFSTVAAMCNGRKSCTLAASYSSIPDPCFGTAKYLTLSYMCTSKIMTCEGNTASLNCGTRKIMIVSANYGRTNSTMCSSGQPPCQVFNTNCYSSNALSIVKASCDGQNTCSIPANNNVFSDPCPYTYKYLDIMYNCV